ncbi:MAG: restriction endonuclease subunit S [Bacteroidales bacterium]|nr:restriction endonuclease subunit S [Bacteroidales bacterium]
MSKLKELIDKLCPDGVEYKKLGEVCHILDAQRKPISKSKRIKGIYPYYGANGIQDYVSDYIFDGTFLLVGEDGSVINKDNSPVLNWAVGKIWVNNHAHILTAKDSNNLRYIYYALQIQDVSKIVRGVPPKINQESLKSIRIPLPHIEVQEEIVRILDNFTKCTAELQAELQAREKQYEYYRNKLLSFEGRTDVEYKKLGEVCEFIKDGTHGSYNNVEDGYPLLSAKDINNGVISIPQDCRRISKEDYDSIYKKYKLLKGDVLITIVGSIGRTAIVGDGIEVAFQRSVGILRPLNIVLSSYLFYALQTSSSQKKLAARTSKSAQGGVYLGELSKIEIPIPTLTEQQRIVDILDRFDTLVNDISQGLPAEIEARQNQYEYYRDRLLSFKRLTT